MNKFAVSFLNVIFGFVILFAVFFPDKIFANDEQDNSGIVLQLSGTGNLVQRFLPGIEEPADCYEGMNVIDVATGRVIGEATDCLSDIRQDGRGLNILGTTIFSFPSGSFMVRGPVTVQPTFSRMITREGMVVTHITGSATNGGSNVIEGTGAFKDADANARLQGMINGDLMEEGIIQFSCFFIFTDIDIR